MISSERTISIVCMLVMVCIIALGLLGIHSETKAKGYQNTIVHMEQTNASLNGLVISLVELLTRNPHDMDGYENIYIYGDKMTYLNDLWQCDECYKYYETEVFECDCRECECEDPDDCYCFSISHYTSNDWIIMVDKCGEYHLKEPIKAEQC